MRYPTRKRRTSGSTPTLRPARFRLPDCYSTDTDGFSLEIHAAWSFFMAHDSAQTQVHQLMRVLDRVLNAIHRPASFYRSLWSAHREYVFGSSQTAASRICRLFQGRKVIDQESQRFESAGRLSLVFLTHDVEVMKAQNWKLAPGQSRQHAAVMSISQQLNMDAEEIRKDWRRSRNYIKLWEECGPASLLELGTGINW
ncbi:uncharacterized protein BP01DRAFT_135860 [Aspergillus saccharolyticus JOP 1030-1]|uniref:Uncharacterized protein n=1 Tax=Aspergillus saccharolyticus JOP 1030-1 TaxID=1450539 RepID=A0A318ZC20_9EURO|nr:hypothetical protein BP01DRAFT_135860 [Aspergillus saccharolyticus JOP 1030-1]PYH42233.1 hypothetical protein BP01DRAFT_135860 [Aspergillus saccharolyticus JOP 1030-1]